MIERGCGLCFSHQPSFGLLVGDRMGRENLDRNGTLEACVLGEVDLTHAARTEPGADFVQTQAKRRR